MNPYPNTPDTLLRSLCEVRALQRYMIEALELQQHEPDLQDHPAVLTLVDDLLDLLRDQIERVDRQIILLPGSRDALRGATSGMAGAFIHFLNKTRSHETAKMLRDDFTLLNVASVSYLMLTTSASFFQHAKIAEVAAQNHQELTAFVEKISRLLPDLVISDLAKSVKPVRPEIDGASSRIEDSTTTPVFAQLTSST
jgi:hypothetical protein